MSQQMGRNGVRVSRMKRPEAEENHGAMTSCVGAALIIKKNICVYLNTNRLYKTRLWMCLIPSFSAVSQLWMLQLTLQLLYMGCPWQNIYTLYNIHNKSVKGILKG